MHDMDLLLELQAWYASHCDGNWEHGYGVGLTTLDNPGWKLVIDLIGTELEDVPFTPVMQNLDSDKWMRCNVKDKQFVGSGGAMMLTNIVEHFLVWQSGVDSPPTGDSSQLMT